MIKPTTMARRRIEWAKDYLARAFHQGETAYIARAYLREAIEHLAKALHAIDKVDRLSRRQSTNQGAKRA